MSLSPLYVFLGEVFEALFPCAGALGYSVCFAPCLSSQFICARVWGLRVLPAALPAPFSATLSPALWVYLCANVGLQGLLVVGLPAPFFPHSQSLSRQGNGSPLLPGGVSTPPTRLDVCFFFIYLVSDPLAVRFSVSSGCARRRSVSTYAAILVLPVFTFWLLWIMLLWTWCIGLSFGFQFLWVYSQK